MGKMDMICCPNCANPESDRVGTYKYKCKACGVEYIANSELSDEIRTSLKMANNELNYNQNFDKATHYFKQVLELDKECAEAYWGLFLSTYGVNYVKEKNELKPTVHKLGSESVTDNKWLIQCQECSHDEARDEYEKKAKEIEEIRKYYYEISCKEEPYDIFICYKKTELDSESLTRDNQIATELFYNLRDNGYKVFFAGVELERRAGEEYEPIIYNALTTAKAMIVVVAKKEHAEAVWVRNEWSRFVKFSQFDKDKKMFVVTERVNPYDIPEELVRGCQTLDFASLSFIDSLHNGLSNVQFSLKGGIERKIIEKVDVKFNGKIKINNVVRRKLRTSVGGIVQGVESTYVRAELQRSRHQFESAIKLYNEAISLDKNYNKAYWGLWLAVNGETGDDSSDNLAIFENNVRYINNPLVDDTLSHCTEEQIVPYIKLFKAYCEKSFIDELYIQVFQKCVEWCSDEDRLEIAKIFQNNLHKKVCEPSVFESGIDELLRVIGSEDAVDHINILYSLANSYLQISDYALATIAYNKILEINEHDFEAIFGLHLCKTQTTCENYENCEIRLDSQGVMVENFIKYGNEDDGRMFIIINALCNYNNEYACNQMDHIISILPEHLRDELNKRLNKFAKSLIAINEFEKAKKYLKEILSDDDYNMEARWLIFVCEYEFGDLEAILNSSFNLMEDRMWGDFLTVSMEKRGNDIKYLINLKDEWSNSNIRRAIQTKNNIEKLDNTIIDKYTNILDFSDKVPDGAFKENILDFVKEMKVIQNEIDKVKEAEDQRNKEEEDQRREAEYQRRKENAEQRRESKNRANRLRMNICGTMFSVFACILSFVCCYFGLKTTNALGVVFILALEISGAFWVYNFWRSHKASLSRIRALPYMILCIVIASIVSFLALMACAISIMIVVAVVTLGSVDVTSNEVGIVILLISFVILSLGLLIGSIYYLHETGHSSYKVSVKQLWSSLMIDIGITAAVIGIMILCVLFSSEVEDLAIRLFAWVNTWF